MAQGWLVPIDDDALLCRKCDVFVGFGGAGVARVPDVPPAQLDEVCWICLRSRDEIAAAQALP
jgi:hypothetical protein